MLNFHWKGKMLEYFCEIIFERDLLIVCYLLALQVIFQIMPTFILAALKFPIFN